MVCTPVVSVVGFGGFQCLGLTDEDDTARFVLELQGAIEVRGFELAQQRD